MKFNKFVAISAAVSVMMSSCITAFAEAVEYTNGPRVKRVDINDYIYSADDAYTKNPYETNSFAEFSSKQVSTPQTEINVQTTEYGKAIGNIHAGSWVKYDGYNFGEEEKKLESVKIEVAHPVNFSGIVRIYLLDDDGEREIKAPHGVLSDIHEGDILIAEHQFEATDVYGSGWTVPEKLVITPNVEQINGTYDILVTFSKVGLGNYFNFVFVTEDAEADEPQEDIRACDDVIKFSEADLFSWGTVFTTGCEYLHATQPNRWLLYRNIDFGADGVDAFKFRIGKQGDYTGNMRIYAVGDDIANGTTVPQLSRGKLADGELILERYISTSDNTGDWLIVKERTKKLDEGETVRGVKNILITFDNNGLGNLHDFTFEKKTPVVLSDSGNILYDEFVPFIFNQIRIGVSGKEDVPLTVTLNDNEYDVVAKSDDTYVTVQLDKDLFPGAYKLRIEPQDYIHINAILFDKMKMSTAQTEVFADPDKTPYTAYTEMENLMRSAIILNEDSSVYFSSNAKRYINYDDVSELPYIQDGEMYIPVETFSVMTGAYFEEDGDYCQIRLGNTELYKKGNTMLRQDDCGSAYEVENDLIIKNQKHYIPVKKYLEIMGRTIYEEDGLVIADNRVKLRSLSNAETFSKIVAMYEPLLKKEIAANTYYVSQEDFASDENDGSEDAPFATLEKASSMAEAGDTVIIKEGVYREVLSPQNNGTASNPIIFKAAEGEKVTISALKKVDSSYTEEGNMRVYNLEDTLPQGRNQIFLDGEALREGRYPNRAETKMSNMFKRINASPLWPTTGKIKMVVNEDETTDVNTFYCEDAKELPKDFFAGGTLVSFHGYSWTQGTAKISSSEDGYLYLGDKTTNWWYSGVSPDDYGYITGTKNVVDTPGEWYVDTDNDKLYIIPISECDEYEIKQSQLCIDLNDREYVQIIGINTIGGGTRMNDAKMCILNSGEHKYISHYTYSMDQHYGFIDDANAFNKDGAPFRGEVGMYLGGRDNAIINANIKYSAASAIYMTGAYGLIQNNHIEEAGYMGTYVSGIFVMPDVANGNYNDVRGGHRIYFNTVNKTGRGCIEFSAYEDSWFKNYGVTPFAACDIAYNVLSNGSVTSDDTGNIYIHGVQLGDDEEKTKIRNNIIYDGRAQGDSVNAGIYFDNFAQMGQTYENVIFYTENGEAIKKTAKIYVQGPKNFHGSFATIDVWNNSLGETAKQLPLRAFDFPNGKKFRAGANSKCVNYESNESIERSISADELTTVDFEGKYNALLVCYKINNYDTEDKLKVTVGNECSTVTLKANATKPETISSIMVPVNQYDGEKTVSFEYIEQSSSEIVAVMPVEIVADETYALVGKTYGGEFTEGNTLTKLGPDNEHYLAYETYKSKTLTYNDVNISKSVDSAVVSYASATPHAGGKVTMYANDEYLCEFTVNKSSWTDFAPVYIKMSKTLEQGLYDIKVVFDGTGSQTCDFWWFAFENYDTFIKDIYSAEIDLFNSSVAKKVTHEHNGVVATKNSQFTLDCSDFGSLGYFKLIADYDLLTDEGLNFKLSFEGSDENIILKPEMFSGTAYKIPCQMLSSSSAEGIKNVKITFEGEGSMLIKNLEFHKTPIYLESVSFENNKVSGVLKGIHNQAMIAVYSPTGQLKDFRIIKDTDNGFEISASVGDRVKLMGIDSFDKLKPYCEDITHILIQP